MKFVNLCVRNYCSAMLNKYFMYSLKMTIIKRRNM